MNDKTLIIYIVVFVLAIILSILYGIWYWNNCAFVRIFDAPVLCFANSRS